jgi:hypothetical protein
LVLASPTLVQNSGAQEASNAVRFIDIAKFDTDLERALTGASAPVNVTFYDRTSPNNLPNRLQKWISSVEKSGGRVDVEPPADEPTPRSPAMLLGLLGGLWSSIKAWGEIREQAVVRAAQTRDAVIVLERNASGEVVVSRVTFNVRK